MKQLILLAGVVLLAGCATTGTTWWDHDTKKSSQEWHQDLARCEAMAGSAGSAQIFYPTGNNPGASFAQGWNTGSGYQAAEARDRIMTNCLRGEGWYLVED
ncbi:hypothetical protein [Desulfurivibrio sp. C05AmB]|uniref:hypothetical protein n=1 Tax=Desulfurivibrio sp. C05AmB TaxID=3374371 RepID=UPI00376F2CB9